MEGISRVATRNVAMLNDLIQRYRDMSGMVEVRQANQAAPPAVRGLREARDRAIAELEKWPVNSDKARCFLAEPPRPHSTGATSGVHRATHRDLRRFQPRCAMLRRGTPPHTRARSVGILGADLLAIPTLTGSGRLARRAAAGRACAE